MVSDQANVSTTWDIIGLGCAALDTVLYVEGPIASLEGKARVSRREERLGGLSAVGLAAAVKCGASAAFAGLVGSDGASRQVDRLMRHAGIDTGPAVRREGAAVVEAVVVVTGDPPQRLILYGRPALAGADATEPPEQILLAAKVLLCDGFSPGGALRAARIFRSAGRPVVVDVEEDQGEVTDSLIELADHVILSWEFAGRYLSARDELDAVRALWHPLRKACVVTSGSEGCWVTDADSYPRVSHVPAFPVQAVDTTGCGDVFHGVYAALLARGAPVAERVERAAAASAITAATGRGSALLPDSGAIETFLSTQRKGA